MDTNEKTATLLARFNEKERTITEICRIVGGTFPLEVRSYDQGEDACVLVTELRDGAAFGFPLSKGVRSYGEWYPAGETAPRRIPEGGTRIWTLVNTPFDDMEKILFRIDLHGGLDAVPSVAGNKGLLGETPAASPTSHGTLFGNDDGPAVVPTYGRRPVAREAASLSETKEKPFDGDDVMIVFGKYKGMTVGAVRVKDPGYIQWAMENIPAFRNEIAGKRRAA